MTRIAATLVAAVPATQALAHPGPHLHPHGSEGWVIGVLIACALVGLACLKRR